jgi:hypothetical protein
MKAGLTLRKRTFDCFEAIFFLPRAGSLCRRHPIWGPNKPSICPCPDDRRAFYRYQSFKHTSE